MIRRIRSGTARTGNAGPGSRTSPRVEGWHDGHGDLGDLQVALFAHWWDERSWGPNELEELRRTGGERTSTSARCQEKPVAAFPAVRTEPRQHARRPTLDSEAEQKEKVSGYSFC